MVVVIGGADPYHPKVVQASAGTLGKLTITTSSWEELVKKAEEQKVSLCALVVKDGSNFKEISFKNTLLVLGNEAEGLPAHYIAACDQRLTLAMPGGIESLNAAIAGSIALYLGWGIELSKE